MTNDHKQSHSRDLSFYLSRRRRRTNLDARKYSRSVERICGYCGKSEKSLQV